jgi:hypothetical protein
MDALIAQAVRISQKRNVETALSLGYVAGYGSAVLEGQVVGAASVG